MAIINPGDQPIDPQVVDGTELAQRLNRLYKAVYSSHSSGTRPPDITAGGIWSRTSATGIDVVMYDGTKDIVIGSVTGGVLSLNAAGAVYTSGTANSVCYLNGTKVLTTGTGLQFDGANFGLGVTPSAWSGYTGLQVKATVVGGISTSDNALFGSNVFYEWPDFKYINNTTATLYRQLSSSHQWLTAPSGTAGDPITFKQAMSLTAAGNLLLGGTTDPGGTKVLYIGNGTAPGTPTDGGVLYVEAGALKYKGSSGTVTTLGPA